MKDVRTLEELSELSDADKAKITEFSLFNQDITSIDSGLFEKFKSVKHIDLAYNWIRSIPARTFSSCKQLKTISLAHNKIEWLDRDAFDGCTKVESIFLANNKLTKLPSGLLDSCVSLQCIDLQENFLQTLPDMLVAKCTELHQHPYGLRLNHNEFEMYDCIDLGQGFSLIGAYFGNYLVGLQVEGKTFILDETMSQTLRQALMQYRANMSDSNTRCSTREKRKAKVYLNRLEEYKKWRKGKTSATKVLLQAS